MYELEMLARARRTQDMIAFHKAELAGPTIHGPVDTMGLGGWLRALAWRDYFRTAASAHRAWLERPSYS